MSTAEPLPDNIRRIAVLVASVDAATAQQLLLHLPTSIAKQVRRALQNLGPVTQAERQRILTEFQSTAAKQNQAPANANYAASSTGVSNAGFSHNPNNPPQNFNASVNTNDHYSHSQGYSASLAEHSERGTSPLYSAPPVATSDSSQPSWKSMDIRALSHFLRAERATVIAVVINRLSPDTGVSLIQQLPASMHREILQAIANLQDIDEEAMQSIEEHLAERIKNYEQQVNGEAKGTRRIAALLAAAPMELQETWSRFVHIAIDPLNESSPAAEPTPNLHSASRPIETKSSNSSPVAIQTTNKSISVESHSDAAITVVETKPMATTPPSEDSVQDVDAYILKFPGASHPHPLSNTDRSLIQIEFEQILSMSTQQLAQVLTAANSQTVLLALAGASPSFMKQFYAMLTKADAKALASRLSKIGPLNLRDIDEAQRSIAELAAKLTSPRSISTSHTQSLRVAA